jgi:malonate transporter
MWAIFLQTLPFFMLIALGYGSGRTGFFTSEATSYLTKFVFYFALSAMLIRFSANLSFDQLIDWPFMGAYLVGTMAIYLVVTMVAILRKIGTAEAAVEAQVGVIGNTGFLGIPMLSMLLGEEAIGPIMMVLVVDLIVFSSLIVILIYGSRHGRLSWSVFGTVGMGLLKNPMIVSIVVGMLISASGWSIPRPINDFLTILGAAATPGALFAIGASLASKSAERLVIAGWLSFSKLVLHPASVAFAAFVLFRVDPFPASVMVAAASLPVAGNVYILAQHYGVAPARVSASILVSTALSILTVSAVIAWVQV